MTTNDYSEGYKMNSLQGVSTITIANVVISVALTYLLT